jgi:hypothetical protein
MERSPHSWSYWASSIPRPNAQVEETGDAEGIFSMSSAYVNKRTRMRTCIVGLTQIYEDMLEYEEECAQTIVEGVSADMIMECLSMYRWEITKLDYIDGYAIHAVRGL